MKGQSNTDYIIIAGIIFIVLLPLTRTFMTRLNVYKETQIEESISSMKNAVTTIYSLTPKSSTKLLLEIPRDISSSLQDNMLIINYKGQLITTEFPTNLAGNFPSTSGRHNVNLYNNGTAVIISECGNELVEQPVEQCEVNDNNNCNSGANECINGGSYKCQCRCNSNIECFTNLCDKDLNVCIYCNPPLIPCKRGQPCINGICVIS